MKKILLAATSFVVLTGAAQAADLPDTFIEPVAMPMMAPTWTGGYVGAMAGYAFRGDDDNILVFDTDLDGAFDDTVFTGAGANAFGPGFCSGTPNGVTPAAGCDDDDEGGFTGSIRAGYDYQFGTFVAGGLLEFAYVDLEEATTGFSTTPANYVIERELDYTLAARLRGGVAFDRALVYATAGGVYGELDYEFSTSNTANTFTTNNDDEGEFGFQVGGGVEYLITENLSLTGEYLYTRFDADDFTVRAGGPVVNPFTLVNPAGTDFKIDEDEFDYHTVHAGVSYRF